MTNIPDDSSKDTRREFIKKSAKAVAGISALPLVGSAILKSTPAKAAEQMSRVALVISNTPVPEGEAAIPVFRAMLEAGIEHVAGDTGAKNFWHSAFSPEDHVAIKVNNFVYKKTRGPQLVEVVCEGMTSAGVVPENIVIYEHSDGALERAGFKINHDGPGVRCYGTDYAGYMAAPIKSGACNALYTSILDKCTALVNMPVLKAHNMAGITLAMKNHYGSFENPRQYHGNDCDPFIADINSADIIHKKTRLVVCDAVKALFAGGPEWMQEYVKDLNAIIVATDPVAHDSVGHMILKKLRKDSGMKQLPYNPEPKQLKSAEKKGIGVADLKKIDFKKISV